MAADMSLLLHNSFTAQKLVSLGWPFFSQSQTCFYLLTWLSFLQPWEKNSPQSIKIQHPLWKVWRYICKMVWWNLMLLKYMQHLQDCQIKCFHSIQLAECFIFFPLSPFFLFLINIHISPGLPDYLQVSAHHWSTWFFPSAAQHSDLCLGSLPNSPLF